MISFKKGTVKKKTGFMESMGGFAKAKGKKAMTPAQASYMKRVGKAKK